MRLTLIVVPSILCAALWLGIAQNFVALWSVEWWAPAVMMLVPAWIYTSHRWHS